MSRKILQINLRFNVSAEELAKEFEAAAVPERGEAAGIYLFEDDASLKAYIESSIIARMKTIEAFSDITMKDFDVVEDATAITRGPVK